jgi:glucosamine kinase
MVIGVDGGGSRTRVLVADEAGQPLASAEGGGSAVRPGAVDQSADVIARVVADAVHAVRLENGSQAGRLCVGVAGAGRAAERDELQRLLLERGVAEEVLVVTDAEVALEDAFAEGAGILLVAGTGSIAYGRGPTGNLRRCGGWGPVCGDEGSGAWIGRRVLSVVTAAADGREPETSLTAVVLSTAGKEEVDDLIAWGAAATPAALASLAPAVLDAAAAGDLRANSLLAMAVEELAIHVRTLARQLFGDERAAIPVALTGGLLSKGSLLRKRVETRLKSMVPGAQVRAEDVDAARGAVRLVLRLAGAPHHT